MEALLALLYTPLRKILVPLVIDVLIGILQRRHEDPVFRQKSDDLLLTLSRAATKEEIDDASRALHHLVSE